jgi:uncharacterized damage-inducible protein DinB
MENPVAELLIKEAKFRLLEESIPRLHKCLNQLSIEEIWFRPNQNTVSIGNLVLHLCGNVRQWLISGLGGVSDNRERQQEFDASGPLPTEQLTDSLESLTKEIERVLEQLTTDDLLASRSIQGYKSSGVSILVHVVEHFSYHVGQVTILVKSRKDIDMGYYAGQDLDKKNED